MEIIDKLFLVRTRYELCQVQVLKRVHHFAVYLCAGELVKHKPEANEMLYYGIIISVPGDYDI